MRHQLTLTLPIQNSKQQNGITKFFQHTLFSCDMLFFPMFSSQLKKTNREVPKAVDRPPNMAIARKSITFNRDIFKLRGLFSMSIFGGFVTRRTLMVRFEIRQTHSPVAGV